MTHKIKIGVIGGSGVYKLDNLKIKNEIEVKTPFGDTSSKIMEMGLGDHLFYFLPRHGISHTISPSEINYRANIFALKSLGVDTIISISAVGSLKEELEPTKFVIVDQFIDWTKGKRERSFFEKGMVGHVSCAYPIEKNLQKRIGEICAKLKINYKYNGTYICIEGPQFSSRAESLLYRSFGADVIGMTNVPESYLAKEAGMAYATVAMVTDYDCWKETEHCSLEEIMKVMQTNYKTVQLLLNDLIPSLVTNPITFNPENKTSVVTNFDKLTSKQKEIVKVLVE